VAAHFLAYGFAWTNNGPRLSSADANGDIDEVIRRNRHDQTD